MGTVIVKRQGKQWGVYLNGQLHEGGFFRRDAAENAAATLRAELTPPTKLP